MHAFSRLALVGLSTLAAASVADAGVAIEFSHTGGANSSPGTIEVFIDGHNLAASMAEGDVVFRGEDQIMWFAEAGEGHLLRNDGRRREGGQCADG